MANRYPDPDITYVDATGAPYAGAQLFFYETNSSTKLAIYSNAGLSIARTNPVVLDSAGRAGSIFLQNAQYKVVLAPADDTDPPTAPIWTQDPVYTSDYSAAAKFTSGSGSPNGTVAGTAGSTTTLADSYWDIANNILYICTTTGTATTAVWTAINASTAAAVVPSPQGILTPTSGTPIIPGDSSAATTLYYTPYNGLLVPIYNGTSFAPTSIISQLQYTLTSSLVAANIYDCYIFLLNGVATLGSSPSWSAGSGGSVTAGSCARGTGAGGTALSRLSGINTNAVSMTMRYGDGTTTTTVAANQGTYVGSIYMDGTNGQVSCLRTRGQNRKWGIWNAYNRVPVTIQVGDDTASWTYNSATIRASNNVPAAYSATEFNVGSGTASNGCVVFSGLAEDIYNIEFGQNAGSTNSSTGGPIIGVGFNSTTAFAGMAPTIISTAAAVPGTGTSTLTVAPTLGISNLCCLEKTTVNSTFYGTSANMVMTVTWRA